MNCASLVQLVEIKVLEEWKLEVEHRREVGRISLVFELDAQMEVKRQ